VLSSPAPGDDGPAAGSGPRPDLAARLRTVHMDMVAAVVAGEGLGRVCNLAADAVKAPVAVIVPRLGAYLGGDSELDLAPLRGYVEARLQSKPAPVPPLVELEVGIESGGETVGAALALAPVGPEAPELLHAVSVAVLTELAMAEARLEVEENLRGTFLEQLRSGAVGDSAEDVLRRATRFGCDLSQGAVALCAEPTGERVRHLVALVTDEAPGALAQLADDGRVYGLIPPAGDGDAAESAVTLARRVAARLRPHGSVGLSSYFADPVSLARALEEAALVLDVVRLGGAPGAGDVGDGTYRLLFRVLASHPEEVRSFYDDTIEPLVRYDEQYGSDLVGTLEAWFAHDCSTVATAGAVFVHRHTVAYRLERVKELSGLDPFKSEDRERLGLGLKAGRIIAPGSR
jgi:PucR family transcriptional regulator, purine catabolism regulatory protein